MAMPAATVRRRGSIYDARIAGLYDLEETIGRGHFAVVKVAKHVFTGEKVAVKVIDKTKLDPVSKEHLFQEVRCMKLVQHPNIVRLYEVIDTQTKLFLILELGDYDMFEYIVRQGENGVTEREAQRHFCQIVRAISYCHKLHVVHRDLKPENVVFVEKLGMVKLTDFGFSNLFTPGQQLDTSCGSLAYSAPEILLGDSYDAPAVDLWSLGVILYMMVCGRLPFQEANDSETLTKILDCSFTLPSNLSEDCQHLIRRMLVRDPAKRATLNEISESEWVRSADYDHAAVLPLVSRDHISDETHTQIVEQMVNGNIAEAEDICRAVERDEYSYITATYYLLIERHLKKERQEQAQNMVTALTKSDSQLQLASLALSPRVREKRFGNTVVLCTCTDSSDNCACVQSKLDHTLSLNSSTSTAAPMSIEGLVSPIAKSASTGLSSVDVSATTVTQSTSAAERRWHQRACSIVREESEDDISVHLRSSRSASPVHGASPMISPLPSYIGGFGIRHITASALMEFHELSGRTSNVSGASSNGKTTPDRSGSRSPSPVEGRASPMVAVAGKYVGKPSASTSSQSVRKLPTISSSPHLVGICEEGEFLEGGVDDEFDAASLRHAGRASPHHHHGNQTYSSIRMIRPRQAVVSPDVVRRYDKRVSTSRSRRSTSCSSSEASDDEERRLSLIHTRHCRRRDRQGSGGNDDDDSDNASASGGGATQRRSSTNGSTATGTAESRGVDANRRASNGGNGDNGDACGKRAAKTPTPLDARKLASRLQKLAALAPIREMPNLILSQFGHRVNRSRLVDETRRWFKPLSKPKSLEHLTSIDDDALAAKFSTVAVNNVSRTLIDNNNNICRDNGDEGITVAQKSIVGDARLRHQRKKKSCHRSLDGAAILFDMSINRNISVNDCRDPDDDCGRDFGENRWDEDRSPPTLVPNRVDPARYCNRR